MPFLTIFKSPLTLLSLAGREVKGIIFYHRNFVRNEQLENQNDLLRQRFNTLQEISLENERLRGLLHLKQQLPFKVIAATVIARSPDNWSSLIIIDKGRKSGIKSGMSVITHLGFVGRVIEVSESVSKVMLITDPDFGISALDQRSRQEGLVSGTLGNFLIMRYLPKDSDIRVSDIIVTSGLSNRFPKGLIIGAVVEIGEEFSGLGSYCLVKPSVNLSSIEEALVITQ